MFTESDWTSARPKSGKGSGIAKALKAWHASCSSAPSSFSKYDQFADAREAASKLKLAFTKAFGSMKSDKDSKAPGAIQLIKDHTKEIQQYEASLDKEYGGRVSDVEDQIKSVVAQIDDAKAMLAKLLKLSATNKDLIAKGAAKLSGSLSVAETKKLRAEISRWKTKADNLAKMAKDNGAGCRGHKDVAEFRRAGGEKICAAKGLGGDEYDRFVREFQDVTRKLDEMQLIEKKLLGRADKQTLACESLLMQSNRGLDAVGTAMGTLQALIKALDARHKKSKDYTSKQSAGAILKLDAKALKKMDAPELKKQKHGTESQIEQIKGKMRDLQKIEKDVKKMVDTTVKKIAKDLLVQKDVKPLFDKAVLLRRQINEESSAWQNSHQKAILHADKYLAAFKKLKIQV